MEKDWGLWFSEPVTTWKLPINWTWDQKGPLRALMKEPLYSFYDGSSKKRSQIDSCYTRSSVRSWCPISEHHLAPVLVVRLKNMHHQAISGLLTISLIVWFLCSPVHSLLPFCEGDSITPGNLITTPRGHIWSMPLATVIYIDLSVTRDKEQEANSHMMSSMNSSSEDDNTSCTCNAFLFSFTLLSVGNRSSAVGYSKQDRANFTFDPVVHNLQTLKCTCHGYWIAYELISPTLWSGFMWYSYSGCNMKHCWRLKPSTSFLFTGSPLQLITKLNLAQLANILISQLQSSTTAAEEHLVLNGDVTMLLFYSPRSISEVCGINNL